jgi:ABC-type transport system substrate-binding protein
MLAEVRIRVELQPVETATFNATCKDPATAPLRFATWRPLFDPYTLLSLVVSNQGFLSRYDNPNAQPLIDQGATEADPERRSAIYRQLGRVLHDEPAAIYLYSLTSFYGLAAGVPTWTPRPDDYIIPTAR